jgi:hypothetical protein
MLALSYTGEGPEPFWIEIFNTGIQDAMEQVLLDDRTYNSVHEVRVSLFCSQIIR